MEYSEILSMLLEILKGISHDIKLDTNDCIYKKLIDVGIDSLAFIQMVIKVEDEFDVALGDDILLYSNFENLDQLCIFLQERMSNTDV